ncbi:MAG: hypothetical protein LQ338_005442 [Usnochroma carphineum]|nr:MAG: hypothetical protein LQ338_005442 [Usnochroma carphineum]
MPQGTLYKWEKNSGLDHKCGICKTVLSSPRAKKTCFGIHEEVCFKYHHTLFYLGNSSKCDACRKSVELHDKRHREIAALILKVQKIDESEQATLTLANNRKRKTRKSDALAEFRSPSALDNAVEEGEWGDTSTLNDDELEARTPGPLHPKENFTPKQLAKAERKKAKRSKPVQVITPELMNMIDAALHPENHLAGDKEHKPGDESSAALSHRIIEENIAFNTNCFSPSSLRHSVHVKKLLKANGIGRTPSPQNAQKDPEITSILAQLGINPNPVHMSKERNVLVRQLRNAIRDDTEKVDNENRDTVMRMAGYWRYVNRKTYNVMVCNNEIWDWVTGQKLEEIPEDEGSEADTEEDDHTDVASWDDLSTLATPFSGAGTPVEEQEDYTEDFELNGMKTLQLADRFREFDAKLDDHAHGQHDRCQDDCMTTPRASQFPCDTTSERKSRIPEPKHKTPSSPPRSHLCPPGRNDARHVRPTSISTLKNDEPFDFMPSPLVTPTPDQNTFSTPHRDPNNRYNALTELNGGLNQRLGRTNKSLKLAPPAVLAPRETNTGWTTVKGKGVGGAGRTSYAGALKKRVH